MTQLLVKNVTSEIQSRDLFFQGKTPEKPSFKLENVSFSLSNGEMLAILGPNGSGKTTLLKTLTGMIPILDGQILIDDLDISHVPTSQRVSYLALTFQLVSQQFHSLTVFKELWHVIKVRHAGLSMERQKTLLLNVVKEFSLQHLLDTNPHVLSGGEKRRLSLALLALLSPRFFLFDEPTMGLDVKTKLDFVLFLKKTLASGQHGVIIVTHDLGMLLPFNPHVIILEKGRMTRRGTLNELLLSESHHEILKCIRVPHWALLLIKMHDRGLISKEECLQAFKNGKKSLNLIYRVIK